MGQGFVFAVTPLLTRIYGPDGMALIGLLLAFMSPAAVALSLRYDLAIVLGADERDARVLLALSLGLLVPMSLLSGLLLLALVAYGVGGYGNLPLWSPIAVVFLLSVTGAFTCLRFWCVRRGTFRDVSVGLVQQGAGRALLPLLLAVWTTSWVGLLAGEAAGRILGVRRLFMRARDSLRETLSTVDKATILDCLRRYRSFPAIILPSALFDAMTGAVSLPLFASVYSTTIAGQFFLAQRVVLAPALLVSASVADVYQHRIVEATKLDLRACRSELARAAVRLVLLGAAMYGPAALVAPFVSTFVFGSAWNETGIAIAALTPAAVSAMVTNPLGRTIAMSRIPQMKFLADLVRLGLPLSAIYFCGTHGFSFAIAVTAFAVGTVLGDICYFAVVFFAVAPHRLRPWPSQS